MLGGVTLALLVVFATSTAAAGSRPRRRCSSATSDAQAVSFVTSIDARAAAISVIIAARTNGLSSPTLPPTLPLALLSRALGSRTRAGL